MNERPNERSNWALEKQQEKNDVSFVGYRWPLLKKKKKRTRRCSFSFLRMHGTICQKSNKIIIPTTTTTKASNKRRSYELCIEWIFMRIVARAHIQRKKEKKTNEPHASYTRSFYWTNERMTRAKGKQKGRERSAHTHEYEYASVA